MGDQIERDYLEEKIIKKQNKINLTTEVHDEKEQGTPNASLKKASADDSFNVTIKIKILLIQNVAILLGFMFMLLMAVYSEHIKF